jgi:hypothetical protein
MPPQDRLHGLEAPDGTPRPAPPPSVLRALNAVQQRLVDAQRDAERDSGHLRAAARELLHAVDLSGDVALACVLRNQVAGSYAMRHSIETAVVAALVGGRLHMAPARLLSLAAAALALQATGRHDDSDDAREAARALYCTRGGESDWFACLLLDHAPESQAGDALDGAAPLLRMADRYCAGVSPRNYRRALLPGDALARALEMAPHADMAAAFRDEIGPCPPGTVVLLAGGERGIVAHRDGDRPHVLCLRDAAGRAFTVPLPRRVGEDGCAIAAALGDEDGDLPVSMKQVWGPLASL